MACLFGHIVEGWKRYRDEVTRSGVQRRQVTWNTQRSGVKWPKWALGWGDATERVARAALGVGVVAQAVRLGPVARPS